MLFRRWARRTLAISRLYSYIATYMGKKLCTALLYDGDLLLPSTTLHGDPAATASCSLIWCSSACTPSIIAVRLPETASSDMWICAGMAVQGCRKRHQRKAQHSKSQLWGNARGGQNCSSRIVHAATLDWQRVSTYMCIVICTVDNAAHARTKGGAPGLCLRRTREGKCALQIARLS